MRRAMQRAAQPAMQRDERGQALSTSSAAAAALLDQAIQEFLEYRRSAAATLAAAQVADPGFGLAHCLEAYLLLFQASERVLGKVELVRARLARLGPALDARERYHELAIGHWAKGDLHRAAATLTELLAIWPRDLLAIRLLHQLAFVMGRSDLMLEVGTAVLGRWSADLPGYGFLLGMRAFAEEERHHHTAAERLGRQAVALNPDDLWSVHAVAHVLEMQGRTAEGARWLAFAPDRWCDRTVFRAHLWWHAALFAIETGDHGRALALYDQAIRPGEQVYCYDLHNCCSLLVRLELAGVEVGRRWERLATEASLWAEDHRLALTDLHTALALARTGHPDLAILERSLGDLATRPGHWIGGLADPILLPLIRAIHAFYDGAAGRAVDLLLPLRSQLARIGGSNAQRDLIEQLLLEAALSGGRLELARRLATERLAERPASIARRRKLAAIDAAAPDRPLAPSGQRSVLGKGAVILELTI